MKTNKYLIFILFFTISAFSTLSGRTPISNIEIFDSLCQKAATKINSFIIEKKLDSASIFIDKAEGSWLLQEQLLKFDAIKLVAEQKKDEQPFIEIHIKELMVDYFLSENPDSLERKAELRITAFLKNQGNIEMIDSLDFALIDQIARSDIDYIKGKHPFTNPQIPQNEQTIWEKIAEPLTVISAAVITVILLFSIRSN